MSRKPYKFTGVIYRACAERGPTNRDFTLDDIKELSTRMQNVDVKYNHTLDKEIGGVTLGHIQRSWVSPENELWVEASLYGDEKIPPTVYDRVKNELVAGDMSLSMFWIGRSTNIAEREDDRIADVSNRVMKEVSICVEGVQEAARVVSVLASKSGEIGNLGWITRGSVLSIQAPIDHSSVQKMAAPGINPNDFPDFIAALKIKGVTDAELLAMTADQAKFNAHINGAFKSSLEALTKVSAENAQLQNRFKRQAETELKQAQTKATQIASGYPEEQREVISKILVQYATDESLAEHKDLIHEQFSVVPALRAELQQLKSALPGNLSTPATNAPAPIIPPLGGQLIEVPNSSDAKKAKAEATNPGNTNVTDVFQKEIVDMVFGMTF